jgi:uncharacterized membrane protein YfcA
MHPSEAQANYQSAASASRLLAALLSGAAIGMLGGLIGLGGAEFRLPVLLTFFAFVALEAVILNKAISFVVVLSALVFRSSAVPFGDVLAQWPIVANLLAGSWAGAWVGADVATRVSTAILYRVIAVLLLLIALVLAFGHDPAARALPLPHGMVLLASGIVAGFAIGVVASLLGVAGGEVLIPTLVLLFGVEIRLAGSLSLAISLPTMLVGLARYSREQSFGVLRAHVPFGISMVIGSIAGAFLGTRLLVFISAAVLVPVLASILVVSAIKIWRHK